MRWLTVLTRGTDVVSANRSGAAGQRLAGNEIVIRWWIDVEHYAALCPVISIHHKAVFVTRHGIEPHLAVLDHAREHVVVVGDERRRSGRMLKNTPAMCRSCSLPLRSPAG